MKPMLGSTIEINRKDGRALGTHDLKRIHGVLPEAGHHNTYVCWITFDSGKAAAQAADRILQSDFDLGVYRMLLA